MTLMEAARELRELAGGTHVAVRAEVIIDLLGNERVEVLWYGAGHGYNGPCPTLAACIDHARQRLTGVAQADVEVA